MHAGQHYIWLLRSFRKISNDQDLHFLDLLTEGLHTCCTPGLPIEVSGIWTLRQPQECLRPPIEWCEGSWKLEEEEPETAEKLVQQEVDRGWVKKCEATEETAKAKWGPNRVAKGKLNIVLVERRNDRLVLDTSVNGLTKNSTQVDSVTTPTPQSVEERGRQ